jgi:FixJ family two-component response regulator
VAVIDDDGSFRTALVESLDSLGYGARGFASAGDFLAQDGESSSDCIITDIHMPGMSGFDLLRQLASRGSRAPVIMVTARTDPGLEARATTGGVVCLLKKPFETTALINCLNRALRRP